MFAFPGAVIALFDCCLFDPVELNVSISHAALVSLETVLLEVRFVSSLGPLFGNDDLDVTGESETIIFFSLLGFLRAFGLRGRIFKSGVLEVTF